MNQNSIPDNDFSLETLQQIYLKVVEASPDAIIVVNRRGEIVVFNTHAELLFGYDRVEVLGKTLEMLLPADVRQHHAGHRRRYFEEPITRQMGTGQELFAQHSNGSTFAVQIKLAPLVVAGAGVHTLAVVRRVGNKERPDLEDIGDHGGPGKHQDQRGSQNVDGGSG